MSHLKALRTATLGSWRMLTLGPEYEDTWVSSSDKSRGPTDKQVEGEPGPDEKTNTGPGDQVEPSWRAADNDTVQKYDAVLHLDGLSSPGTRGGVREIVKKHELLKSTPWSSR